MYDEVATAGFYHESPQATRRRWTGIGILALIAVALGGCGALVFVIDYADTALCPFLGLGLAAIALIIAAQNMPARTKQGAEAAARWQAFKRYLQNIDQYIKQGTANAAEIFDKYLPYTIAFGFNNEYVGKFAALGVPAPVWYQPYYYGPGYYGTPGSGGRAGLSGPGGEGGTAGGPPSLQQMSDGMSGSLQSMSDHPQWNAELRIVGLQQRALVVRRRRRRLEYWRWRRRRRRRRWRRRGWRTEAALARCMLYAGPVG